MLRPTSRVIESRNRIFLIFRLSRIFHALPLVGFDHNITPPSVVNSYFAHTPTAASPVDNFLEAVGHIETEDDLHIMSGGCTLQLYEGTGKVPWIRPVKAGDRLIGSGFLDLIYIPFIARLALGASAAEEPCIMLLDAVACADMPSSLEVR